MEIILLGIYSFVWLIFIKLKLLPWTTRGRLLWRSSRSWRLRSCCSSSTSSRRRRATCAWSLSCGRLAGPGTRHRVPVENNRPVKKGTFSSASIPPLSERSALARSEAGFRRGKVGPIASGWPSAARLADEVGRAPVDEQLKQATGQVGSLTASLDLARTRVKQNTELVAAGAGNRFDLEQAQTNVNQLTAQLATARRRAAGAREAGRVKGDLASVAEVKAQIATAQAQVKASEAQVEQRGRSSKMRGGSVADDGGRSRQRHDGQRHAAARLLRCRPAVQRSDDVRGRRVSDFALFNQNELHQVEAATRPRSRSTRIRAASSRRTSTRSSGPSRRGSSTRPATCRKPGSTSPGQFPVKLVVARKTRCFWRPARAARRRSTPSTSRSCTS